jgi:hypothetical protein
MKFIVFCSTNLPIQQRQLQVVKDLWRLEAKFFIPSNINTKKKQLRTANWVDINDLASYR